MRKDWDFVSMEDYSADMAQQSALARGIIESQRREIEELKRTVWHVVHAAGGRVEVASWDLRFRDKDCELITYQNAEKMSHVFIAKRLGS